MKLARIGAKGSETPVVVTDDGTFDISGVVGDIDPSFFPDGYARVRDALEAGGLPEVDTEGVRFGAPLARTNAVICIGMNYAAHAAESGSEPPTRPVIFFKHPNTLTGPNDDVHVTPRATKLDWEVELALVVGEDCWELDSPEAGRAAIAAVTVADDLSERTWQIEESGGQWSKGKCGPDFTPVGPYLVPADGLDLGSLQLRSFVNDEPRQDSNTSDLIFDPGVIVQTLSQYMKLDAGDLILTGTPEGVALSGRFPYLGDGDVVRVEVQGLGSQAHRIVQK